MSIAQHDSGPTSNDLLECLIAEQSPAALNYQIVAQSAEEVQNTESAPGCQKHTDNLLVARAGRRGLKSL